MVFNRQLRVAGFLDRTGHPRTVQTVHRSLYVKPARPIRPAPAALPQPISDPVDSGVATATRAVRAACAAEESNAGKVTLIVLGSVLGGVLLLCLVVGAIGAAVDGGGGDKKATSNDAAAPAASTSPAGPATTKAAAPKTTAAAPPKEKAAGIGDPVRDGKLEFTVTKVKCGVAQVGSEFLNEKAQGQFCLVTLKVHNTGNAPRTLSDSNQVGYAGKNRYSPNTTAGIYANDQNNAFLNEINPGNEVTAVIVFDVPRSVKLSKLVLHDSAFSGGVDVTLA
jgi:hypothetical protein